MKHSNALRGRDGFYLRSDLLGACPFARNQLGCRQGSDLSVRALQRHCLGRAPGPRSSRRPAANAAIKGAVLSLERSLRCSDIRKIIPPMLTPVHAHRLIGSAACALRREKDPAAEADAGTGRSVEVIAAQLAASVAGLALRRPIHISLPEAKWARVRCRLGSARGQP